MPHSITTKHRSKRIDGRPMAENRKADRKKMAAAALASDFRVVKKRKSEQAEREVDTNEELRESNSEKVAKKIKALNKKLKAIEVLRERQNSGEKLDDNQLAKVESLEETLTLIEDFISGRRR